MLDVKTGSGALMHRLEDSIALAKAMARVGHLAGKPVIALVSGMEQPLGTHVGNSLEVKEAIDVLAGRTAGDLLDVSLKLGGYMMLLAGLVSNPEAGEARMREAIASGAGLHKLEGDDPRPGGDPRVCDDVCLLPQASVVRTARRGKGGYIRSMDTTALGMAAQAMGAGRLSLEDQLDYAVGYVMKIRIGDRVSEDTPLCGCMPARRRTRSAPRTRSAQPFSSVKRPAPVQRISMPL